MARSSGSRVPAAVRLLAGVVGLALSVVLLHRISPELPGPPGRMWRHNMDRRIDATAIVYTETGDVVALLRSAPRP